MIRENLYRNRLIFKMWTVGRAIDQISLLTGIPRSSVGYYVRKFNKRAQKGTPIPILWTQEKRDEKAMAWTAFTKNYTFKKLFTMLGEENGLDKVEKLLMSFKLIKKLKVDLLPTQEEQDALDKNRDYIFRKMCDAMTAMNANK